MVLPVSRAGPTREILVLQRTRPALRHFPRFPFFFTLIVASGSIAVLVLPLSLRLTRSLRQLHGLAQEWAEGRLEKRANLKGNDEITQLAGVFNTMAENLQKMLGQRKEFLAFISHELKSPLARMKVALELLSEKSEEGTETKRLVGTIQGEITESERLIDQLLLLSKIEMSPPFQLSDSIEFTSVLRKAFDQVTPLAESSGILIRNQSDFDAARIRGDALLLQRAFLNVLENAVKFSPSGSTVEIRSSRLEGKILIQIVDRGPGIKTEDLGRIFEPFYRGAAAEQKEGSGLGLFLARRIIEMHGGSIAAASNQPSGTVVSIELPKGPSDS
jgi:signal transduction histidine kinase